MAKIYTTLENFKFAKQFSEMFSREKVVIDERGIIRPDVPICPKCEDNTQYNGYNEAKNKEMTIFGLVPKKGKIVCSNPNCDFTYSVPQSFFVEWTEEVGDWLDRNILSLRKAGLSPKIITEHLQEVYAAIYSSEYVRLRVKELTDNIDCPKPLKPPSGVLVHDEQFVKIKGIELKRISTVDANNENVYHDKLHQNRSEETQRKVCNEVKEQVKNAYATVMDGLIASKNAYKEEFGKDFKIQNCLFHFSMNVRDAYKEEVGYSKGRSTIPLQHLIGFFSILNIFFNHDREIVHLRNLQNELNLHIDRINQSGDSLKKKQEYIEDYKETYDYKAAKYLRRIRITRRRKKGVKLELRTEEQAKELLKKTELENVFPKKVQKQIKRLKDDWENFTHCLRDSTIPPTSNKVEQYYASTLNWVQKNNLQSKEQFYTKQKFFLIRRYGMPSFEKGTFAKILAMTSLFLLFFSGT